MNIHLRGTESEILDFPHLDIARGLYPDAIPITKWATAPEVDTNWQTIWGLQSEYVFPLIASIMTVSSSSINDTLLGTGARTVVLEGLDVDRNQISEVIELNGLTPVSTTNEFFRINGMFVVTTGDITHNDGVIYVGIGVVTLGIPDTVYCLITIETYGRSATGFFSVPNDYTLYMSGLKTMSSSTGRLESQLLVTVDGTEQVVAQIDTEGGDFLFETPVPVLFPNNCDISFRARLTNPARPVNAIMRGVLIKNHADSPILKYQFM